MNISRKLYNLRNDRGMTQAEIAKIAGVSDKSVSAWESGKRGPKINAIKNLCTYFHLDLASFIDEQIEEFVPTISMVPTAPNISPLPQMKQWKVLGGTACGEPIFKPLDEESVLAPADIDADFVFRCVGDSMINARIFDGDVVFIKRIPVEDGQIGVVRIGEEYTLKRIYHGPDYLELRSENPMYKPIIVRGEQENAEIVGRAVHFLSHVI